MKKITMLVLSVMLVLFGPSVWAQSTPLDNAQKLMQARHASGTGGMYPPVMSKEKIEKFMQSLIEMGLLYKMLEQPTMVSTGNGIIVAYGNTLRKYDKDLNVVKEVDLDVDLDGMQELAAKFAKKYSSDFMDLMSGMPGSPGASAGASPSAPTGPSANTTASGSNKSFDDQKEEAIKKEIDQMK